MKKWYLNSMLTLVVLFFIISINAANGEKQKKAYDYDVIVIGAGMGGLSTAAVLQKMFKNEGKGRKVLLIERRKEVGGCTTYFSVPIGNETFNFESSLHQTTPAIPVLTAAGIKANYIGGEDPIQILDTVDAEVNFFKFGKDTIDELYITIVDDKNADPGSAFFYKLPANAFKDLGRLRATFQNDQLGIYEFFKILYQPDITMVDFRNFSNSFKDKMDSIGDVLNMLISMNDSLETIMDKTKIKNKYVRTLLSQYWTYLGPPPSTLWGQLYILMMNNYSHTCCQVIGTSKALSEAYRTSFEKNGGTLKLQEEAVSIMLKKIKGNPKALLHSYFEKNNAPDQEYYETAGVVTRDTKDLGYKIEVSDNSKSHSYLSKYVVSAIGPFNTFYNPYKTSTPNGLIGKPITEEINKKMKNRKDSIYWSLKNRSVSNSLFSVYLPLNKTYENLGIQKRGEESFEVMYQKTTDADKLYEQMMAGDYTDGFVIVSLYSNLTRVLKNKKIKTDFRYAPEKKSVITLTTYANPDLDIWDDPNLVQEKANEVLDRAIRALKILAHKNKTSFDEQIFRDSIMHFSKEDKILLTGTPRDIHEFTGQYKGIPYGWNATADNYLPGEIFERMAPGFNRTLFQAGSWTFPSMGIQPSQISGLITAGRIKNDIDKWGKKDQEDK